MPDCAERAESDLGALFARYPDIKFNSTPYLFEGGHDKDHYSSPCSNITDHDSSRLSRDSASTANTTPLRPAPRPAGTAVVPKLADFLAGVDRTDLPEGCKDGFKTVAHEMKDIAGLLVPRGRYLEGYANSNREDLLGRSRRILAQLQECNSRLEEQVRNLAYVKTLAPFTVKPAPQDTWGIYRQRARLIVNCTALPSRTERKLLVHLAHLFDAYVYHPFLQLLGLDDIDLAIQTRINELYNMIMTALSRYRRWWDGMKDLRDNCMLPLMRRIRKDSKFLREIEQFEQAREAVKAGPGILVAVGAQPADEIVVGRLKMTSSHGKGLAPLDIRNGSQRENTV